MKHEGNFGLLQKDLVGNDFFFFREIRQKQTVFLLKAMDKHKLMLCKQNSFQLKQSSKSIHTIRFKMKEKKKLVWPDERQIS